MRRTAINTWLFVSALSVSQALQASGDKSQSSKPSDDAKAAEAKVTKPVVGNREYNPGTVEPFPGIVDAKFVLKAGTLNFSPESGRVAMIVFVASWCEPCQQIMADLRLLANRFGSTYVDTVFVFSHDTAADALGFAKEHKLAGRVVLANHEVLKGFKNPSLPAVYLSDRHKFMGRRFIKLKKEELPDLEGYLSKITAL